MEELALSKFIEEYLDFMIPAAYEQYSGQSSAEGASHATKVLNDILMIMETERVLIKTFNALIANFIHPVKGKITAYLQAEVEDKV